MRGAASGRSQGMIARAGAPANPVPMNPIRSRSRAPRGPLPTAALVLLAACSGGGGGGPARPAAPVPRLVLASFQGVGPGPALDEPLVLVFSDAVELTGAVLDDADLELSAGGSVGAPTVSPELVDARTVRMFVGAGATFAPGTTTLAFRADNDAIRGVGGGPLPDAGPVTVVQADGEAPATTVFTVEGIDPQLAGNGPAGGTLQVPRNGFTLDLAWTDGTSGIDPATTAIVADRDVPTTDGGRRAGADLSGLMTRTDRTGGASYLLPAAIALPPGDLTLTALVVDRSGRTAAPRTFRLRVVTADESIRPFERRQVWFLSFARDLEHYTLSTQSGMSTVEIASQPNGREDAFDALAIIGLWSDVPLPAVQNGLDSNQVVRVWFEQRVITELEDLFDGAEVEFTFTAPGTFPSGRLSVGYGELGFSQLCLGGAPAATPRGTLGAALFDPNNQTQNDDCGTTSNGDRLGVFLHTLVNFGVRSGPSSTIRQTFDPFTPAFGGTPVGEAAGDAARLNGSTADARATAIDVAIRRLARSVAVVAAHECGHSMGLVANGPMPAGLYGGDPINFPTSSTSPSLHIETSSSFPPGSQNVMSGAIDFDASLSQQTGFNSLNRAYLRERALYDRQ